MNEILVRVNGAPWPRDNRVDALFEEDVSSQVTGNNSVFVVSSLPIMDGSSRDRVTTRTNDIIVKVAVSDEDASGQFTGTEKMLITQHRRILPAGDPLIPWVPNTDVTVKVNGVAVVIESIEPFFGRVILTDAPIAGSTITVSYSYRAKVISVDGNSGLIGIVEKPLSNQSVSIIYYRTIKDGWRIETSSSGRLTQSKLIFDRPKQTSNFAAVLEDVSSQFDGETTKFSTAHKNIVPPGAGPRTQISSTQIGHVFVNYNGESIIPVSVNAVDGIIDLGFAPAVGSMVLTSYNYRTENQADLISIDYYVSIKRCRKCRGTGQINDIEYDKMGQVITVHKEFKMLQDLRKYIIAVKGTNKAHSWYGTVLINQIGTARTPAYYIVKFKGEILDAANNIKNLQAQQSSYQTVDDEEFINFLDDVIVEQSEVNPNLYEISVTIISQSSSSIELNTDLLFNTPLLSGNSLI